MPKYDDIEMAFEYVSSASYGTNRAVYDKVSRQFLYQSDMTGDSEIPEDKDPDEYIEIPHKNDLDLGRNLVFRFVEETIPEEEATVQRFFRRPGAYGNFKDFLADRELLERWFEFEASAQREAIENWCKENGMEIT